ncbi:hypothetical protein ABT297_16070 [Dactylosporangium sp. NPDC000555]|uniref:hypothetical protein n=1 Tax=Dactylosporangium sp. NPDC000555 TaxID=3154260 RepID=UPI00331DD0D1
MTADGEPVKVAADGNNKYYGELVQVRKYDANDERFGLLAALDEIARMLTGKPPHDNDEGVKTVAVVGRAGDHASRLQTYFTGGTSLPRGAPEWANRLTRDYLRVVHHLIQGDLHAAFSAYETFLFSAGGHRTKDEMRRALAEQWATGEADVLVYRRTIVGDLKRIELQLTVGVDVPISAATGFCGVDLVAVPSALLVKLKTDCGAFRRARQDQDRMLSSLFAAKDAREYFRHRDHPDVRFAFSTIHGVKGETYDGVVFYTRAETDNCSCPPGIRGRKWSKILTHSLVECEHKRLAYVALSRAAQVLFILAPDESFQAWSALAGAD